MPDPATSEPPATAHFALQAPVPDLVAGMDEEEVALTLGLGILVREAAAFEYTVHGLVADLLNESHAYDYKGSKVASEQIKTCMAKLPNHQGIPAASRQALAHDLELGKAYLEERNRFIHGCWTYDRDRQSWLTVKDSRAKGADRPEYALASAAEIWELAAEFSRLDAKLTSWDATYFGEEVEDEDGNPGRASVKRI